MTALKQYQLLEAEGRYFDGKTAQPRDVVVKFGDASLMILDHDDMPITHWPLATLRSLGVADDDPRVNAQGGAIAIGHPLGMSGARLVMTAAYQLKRAGGRYALCTMCVGVGQGVAMVLERA